MSGRLGVVAAESQEPVHLRAALLLDDGMALRFVDMRKFGPLYVLSRRQRAGRSAGGTSPEPLEDELTLAAFRERLAQRRTRLKALLLDQRFLAGGNIYVDEALFRAGLHPLRSAAELTARETARLYEACRMALTVAINNGGRRSGPTATVGGGGAATGNCCSSMIGRTSRATCVAGEIEKLRVAGRGTHLCPVCQPLDPLAPATVAVRTRRVAELDAPYLAESSSGGEAAEG